MEPRDIVAVPDGAHRVQFNPPPNMPNCVPLVTVVMPDGVVYSEWRPSEAELARLLRGEAVRLWIWACPIPPVAVEVTDGD